ncbi:MAG: BMP family ABC transporter substrate-binding protein, partial [Acidimicrobiia bacterium]
MEADLKRGLSGELIGELERLVDERPLDERPVSQLMLAQYRAGRQADALRCFERFRRGIGEELGLDPSPELRRLEEQILLHDSRLQTRTAERAARVSGTIAHGRNPFRGLEAFREEDTDLFFGRDHLVSDILRRFDEHSIVSLVGSSGCGKSSAVRSGVIPALRKGSIPGSDLWLIAQMVPGSNPFAELEAALLRSSLDAPNSLREQLDGSPGEILRAVLRVSPADDSRIVIVVDQFEELFTLCDPDTSNRFLTALVEAASDPHGRIRVITTLRADFYDRPLGHPKFGIAMGEGVVNVVPMAPEELEQAASQPAERAGVRLEPSLEAALIGDVLGEPGALPLFQFALTDLFDRRVGDTLTLSAYREMGGIHGTISRKAEQLYGRLTPDQQAVARQVFLRLVAISDAETRSRRRVEAAELLALQLDIADLQSVLDAFGRQRLLSFDRNDVTGSPTVEVAHEALLEHWDRLAGWIERGMEDVRHNVRLVAAAGEWAANGREDGYLLTGGRLDRFESWADTSTLTLARTERDYLDASIAARDDLLAEDEERAAREAATTRRAKRNAFGLVAVIIAVAVVGSFFLWVALQPEGPTVALMYRGGGVNSIDDLLQSGFARADQDLEIVAKEYVAIAAVETQLREVAEAGTELIIAGLDYGFFVASVAGDFPDTTFVTMDPGSGSELSNVYTIGFADAEGAYLMGAIAAMKSQASHIGVVGASQVSFIEQFFGPFDAGARSVNPDIEVSIDWVSQSYSYSEGDGFTNPSRGREAALHLYELGADVVFHVANESGSGVHAAAAEYSNNTGEHVWSIGVDVDEGFEAGAPVSDHVLTSMVKQFDSVIYQTIRSFLDGSLEKSTSYGLADGGISYSEFGGHLADVEAEIAAVEQRVVAGDADLPLISALPSSFRSTPVQTIDIILD